MEVINAKNSQPQTTTHKERVAVAKAGMRRPDPEDSHGTESNKKQRFPKNDVRPVPELQGKPKSKKEKAKPITEE